MHVVSKQDKQILTFVLLKSTIRAEKFTLWLSGHRIGVAIPPLWKIKIEVSAVVLYVLCFLF